MQSTYTRGTTYFELSNHLGNVLAVVTDRKLAQPDGNGGIDFYRPDIVSATDYYPFGFAMEGRGFSSDNYRFGFNGMEKDNEVKGSGNSYDFGARLLDVRLGRWLAVDPLAGKYPGLSPYCFVGNSPLIYIDPDGKKIVVVIDGVSYVYKAGVKPKVGSPDLLFKIHEAATYNMQTDIGKKVWEGLSNSSKTLTIRFKEGDPSHPLPKNPYGTNYFQPNKINSDADLDLGTIYWDCNSKMKVDGNNDGFYDGFISPSTILFHELSHAYTMDKALENGVDSKEWSDWQISTSDKLSPDAVFGTTEERSNVENFEFPYVKEINDIEGEGGSFQQSRSNYNGELDYKNNNSVVNKNSSKEKQNEYFNNKPNEE